MKRKITEVLATAAMTAFGLFGVHMGSASATETGNHNTTTPYYSQCVMTSPWTAFCVIVDGTQVCYEHVNMYDPYTRECFGV